MKKRYFSFLKADLPLNHLFHFTLLIFTLASGKNMANDIHSTPLKYYTTKLAPFKKGKSAYLGKDLTNPLAYAQNAQIEKGYDLKNPLIPFLPFSVRMDFDLVLGVNDGPYSMYEIVRFDISEGKSLWFTLDSKFDGRQYIGLPQNLEDAKLVKKMAETLGVKTYNANLVVTTKDEYKKGSEISIKFLRIDPDNEIESKDFAFEVTIPKSLDLDSSNNTSLTPSDNKRQAHGMNHSAMKLMAMIDIYKTVPFLKLGKIKFKDLNKESPLNLQSILGIKVKSPIAQTIMGLSSGSLKISNNTHPLELIFQSTNSKIYHSLQFGNNQVALQKHIYYFDLVEGKEELRNIDIIDPIKDKLIGNIAFNPSLPDIRYALSSGENRYKVAMSMDGIGVEKDKRDELPTYYLGEVFIQNDSDGKSKIIEMRAGNADKSIRYQFKKTPEWFYKRPFVTFISPNSDKTISLTSTSLAPTFSAESSEIYEAIKVNSLNYISEYKLHWQVRPHRLSRFSLRANEASSFENRSRQTGDNTVDGISLYLEGGTWGNGAQAKDRTRFQATENTISGEELYTISTRSYPMVQDLNNFPLKDDYFTKEKAYVSSLNTITIQLRKNLNPNSIIPFLNGYKFATGPNHKEIGVTTNSLSIKIQAYNYDTLSGLLKIKLFAKKGFGPELSRPYKGPWRQNLESYSSLISYDIGIAVSKSDRSQKRTTLKFSKNLGTRISKPGRLEEQENKVSKALNVNIDTDNFSLVQGFSFAFTSPKTQQNNVDEKLRSRYIRDLNLQANPFTPIDQWDFSATNDGEISWATTVSTQIDAVTVD